MEKELSAYLATKSLPALQGKGLSSMKGVKDVDARNIHGLWTGEGGIAELTLRGDDDTTYPIIAKSIGTYKSVGDGLGLQDHWSYYNEMSFYETDLADQICTAGAPCPRPLFVHRSTSGLAEVTTSGRLEQNLRRFGVKPEGGGEEKDEGIICMTKLPGGPWRPSAERTRDALSWLARLHALFWGNARADAAVAVGVSDQACFWHLDNRQIELGRMSQKSPLRLAAAGIDARLKADAMQTLCHGDPKGANIMFDNDLGVSMYDFQWLGKAPPTKDLAYFFATAAMNRSRWNKDEEEGLLRYYHDELCRLLEAQGDSKPTFEYLFSTYQLAVVDYGRWIEGGFPWGNMALIGGHTEAVLKILNESGTLKSEKDYHDKIFECFPP